MVHRLSGLSDSVSCLVQETDSLAPSTELHLKRAMGNAMLPDGVPFWAFLIFQTVFCATSATIVSGAMAERTKFSAYCVYSFLISLIVYPVSGHWIWGGGFISQMGFHDFAGSCAVHMVGGIAALVGCSHFSDPVSENTQKAENPKPFPVTT